MSSQLRIIALGDTHYCLSKHRPPWTGSPSLAEVPDHARYSSMVSDVLMPLRRMIMQIEPDLVVSVGDYIEGGLELSPAFAEEEQIEGWRFLADIGCPVLIAKGTHEGAAGSVGGTIYRDRVLPMMSAACGHHLSREYYRVDRQGVTLLFLDYQTYVPDGEQERWFITALDDATQRAQRIIVVAHPPLYLWGRHFFESQPFSMRVSEIIAAYPVAAYLCGHTHNQTVSFHRYAHGRAGGFVQITASSVGYAHMPLTPLSACHHVADYGPKHHLLWGIAEDSAPGFYDISIDGDDMRVRWQSLSGEASFVVSGLGAVPSCVVPPAFPVQSVGIAACDRHLVRAAFLRLYSAGVTGGDSMVAINGVNLGPIPGNSTYAARRELPLVGPALATLSDNNVVTIRLPSTGDCAIGSLSLELLLADGRTVRSEVAEALFACGGRWRSYRSPDRFTVVTPGQCVQAELLLASRTGGCMGTVS